MVIFQLRHQPLCLCLISLALLGALQAQGESLQPANRELPRQRQVFAAWDERNAAIKSYVMRAEIEEVIVGRGNRPADPPGPFNDTPPKANHVAKVEIEYAYEHEKAALKRFSDGVIISSDPERPQPQTLVATFDGRTNARFGEQGGSPLVLGEMATSAEAGPTLAVNSELIPVHLWRQPKKVFENVGWKVHKMSLEDTAVEVDGLACRRIRLPRNSHGWTSTLDVDERRGWLPIQWQGWLYGKLKFKWTLKYGHHNDFGPVMMAWQYLSNNETGELRKTQKGRVTEYDINGDVDESRFLIQFPVGTHIVKMDGNQRSYFIQMPKGLRPIDKEEYGKVKPTEL